MSLTTRGTQPFIVQLRDKTLGQMVASRIRQKALDQTRRSLQKKIRCKLTHKWVVKEKEKESIIVNIPDWKISHADQ